jgi:hypothetical protein
MRWALEIAGKSGTRVMRFKTPAGALSAARMHVQISATSKVYLVSPESARALLFDPGEAQPWKRLGISESDFRSKTPMPAIGADQAVDAPVILAGTRCTERDRDIVREQLAVAFAEGCLSQAEHELRLDFVMHPERLVSELPGVLADLPKPRSQVSNDATPYSLRLSTVLAVYCVIWWPFIIAGMVYGFSAAAGTTGDVADSATFILGVFLTSLWSHYQISARTTRSREGRR